MESNNKKTLRNLALILGIPILLIIIFAVFFANRPQQSYKTSEIVALFKDQKVQEYDLDFGTGAMTITTTEKTQDGQGNVVKYYTVPSVQIFWIR